MHIITIHLLTYNKVKIKSPFPFTGMVIDNNLSMKQEALLLLTHKNLESLRKQRFYYKKIPTANISGEFLSQYFVTPLVLTNKHPNYF